ncbi:MAG: hypothetical protein ACRENA_02110 [Vulcanimicrobiaceae bacterium]
MIVENSEAKRAERFGAIVDLALTAWAQRWPLYLVIALASIAIEYPAALLAHYDETIAGIIAACVDGLAMAFVSLDVAARFSEHERSLRELAAKALRRWPLVAFLFVEISLMQGLVAPGLFGSPEQTLYGILILPTLAVFGFFGVVTVVASIDESTPQLALLFYAIYRSVACAAAWPNLGRLTVAGAMVAVPIMLQTLLQQWLASRGFAAGPAFFWANIPVDALCVAPFQAFFTYLYLDFMVREQRR